MSKKWETRLDYSLFAMCDLCGLRRAILKSHILSLKGGVDEEVTERKCTACGMHYFDWKGKRYVSQDGYEYRLKEKIWRIA